VGKSLVIFNPISGHGRAVRHLPEVEAELRALGIAFDVEATRESLHAVQLAWEAPARGYERVLAMGGDGLVHEIVNGLLRASGEGETLPLGIIPLGNGNDFNKMIPVPAHVGEAHNDWREAIKRICSGETRLYDAGRITGDHPRPGHPHPTYFHNAMDVGFGAQVAKDVRTVPSFLNSTAMYFAGALRTLVSFDLPRVKLQLADGATIEQAMTMLAVANGRCVGGGFWIAPNAEADDEQFDVMIGKGLGRPAILGLMPRVMRGTHLTHPAVRLEHSARVVMDSPDPLVVEADGEIPFLEAHHLEIEMVPHCLRIIV
jgi:YegS/Rv2252/BmrU family lipid kinase